MTHLSIPDITEDQDPISAALAYTKAGWYVLPVDRASKHAGSVLGKGWPHKTSQDPETIIEWFTGTDHALALHVGRSGAIAFDVDNPHQLTGPLADAITTSRPPFQSTRVDVPGRGHYLFTVPTGRSLGNRQGQLGRAWGEVRGRNGIIIVSPSEHEKAADGGRYLWVRTGVLPGLPDEIGLLLPDVADGEDAATDQEVKAFLDKHTTGTRPELLKGILGQFSTALAEPGSRHMAVLLPTANAMREAAAGLYPALEAADQIRALFIDAMSRSRDGSERVISESAARAEFAGILAWAIAQLNDTDVQATRRRVEEELGHDDPSALVAGYNPSIHGPFTSAGNLATLLKSEPSANQAARLGIAEARTHHYSDDRLALTLAAQFGDRIRYCPERGLWLTWDGSRWRWCERGGGQVREYARIIGRHLPDDDKADKSFKHRALSAAGVTASLSLAQTDERLVVSLDQLDAHPWELNTPDGIVNLRTGQLTPSDPAKLHTRMTLCSPDPNADATRWLTFLHTTFGGDEQLIAYLRRLMGYSATGYIGPNVLPFAHGEGGNGKGVFLESAQKVLGDYATTAPISFLMASKYQSHETEIARLTGARMVLCSEVNEGDKFDEARIKQLTGGDTLTARFMREDYFTFTPTHHLWLMGNSQPTVTTGGRAFWRRLRLVPFTHKVSDDDIIDDLQGILAHEHGPAVLAWIVTGAVEFAIQGLKPEPETVTSATAQYEQSQDTITRFLEERCWVNGSEGTRTGKSDLRKAYEKWCEEEGETAKSAKAVCQKLLTMPGIGDGRTGKHRYFTGVGLYADEDSEDQGETGDGSWYR